MKDSTPILDVRNLVKHFPVAKSKRVVNAVNDVSFSIAAGETLGMVGESGSGKSTIARAILRLTKPTSGQVDFRGQDLAQLSDRQVRHLRSDMQMVFQDPWSALNPRMRIRNIIAETLLLHEPTVAKSEREDRTEQLAKRVHLSTELLNRFPSDLSGGQLQRVCIARAIATSPKLIILDEPTSSLDLSVRAGILELLAEIKEQTQAALLFISHDLGTVRLISDRIVVLYLGRVVEQAHAEDLFQTPVHPYSQALLSAHLPADPTVNILRHMLAGEIPSPINMPSGCAFHTRCPVAVPDCSVTRPELINSGNSQTSTVACSRVKDGGNWLNPEDVR